MTHYKQNNHIDLDLSQNDLVSLSIVLTDALAKHNIGMIHETLTRESRTDFHPTSHIGRLVALMRRVDRARHGRKTWNDRRHTYGADRKLIDAPEDV